MKPKINKHTIELHENYVAVYPDGTVVLCDSAEEADELQARINAEANEYETY